ncbi:MAG: hypothetical protein A2Z18_02090, partial [Armatimonadetes bacterium RBG_16_58_9]
FALNFWKTEWFVTQSYYSHGPLVPIIAAFLIWANRERIAATKVNPTWLGVILIVPGVPMLLFGNWSHSGALCSLSFFFILFGTLLLFVGTRMTRVLLLPVLYLLFMVPLPSTILDESTQKIQLTSTAVAAVMLEASGLSVTREGARILNGPDSDALPEPLIVGAPCSGFKMFIALATFTVLFVFLLRAAPWKKAVIVGLALPLSIFVNALRISSIGWIGVWTQSADAMHKFHDTGAMIFELVISFAILFGVAKLIKADDFRLPSCQTDPSTPDAASVSPVYKNVGRGGRGIAATVILALLLTATIVVRPLDSTAKGRLDRSDIPSAFGSWTSGDIEPDKVTKELLYTADLLQREFVNLDTQRQVMVFVEAAKDTTSFHNPHSCLPGGGSPVTQDETVTLKLDKPKPMTIKATMLTASSAYGSHLVIHWYMCGPNVYSDTPAIRRAVRAMQVKDLVNIVVHPGDRKETRREIGNRQYYWYRFSTDVWDEDSVSDVEELKQFIRDFVANGKNFGE